MAEKPVAAIPAATAAKQSKPTRILFIHGEKGGIGKSMVAQAVADYLKGTGQTIAVVDTDTANPDVARMFDTRAVVARYNLGEENGWMQLMDFVKAHAGEAIIINTPAGIAQHMRKYMDEFAKFVKLLMEDYKIQVDLEWWWVMSLQHDVVNQLEDANTRYGKYFSKIRVICNLHYSGDDRERYYLWTESPLKVQMEKANAMTLYFPGLHMRVVNKLFNPARIMPFSEAMDAGTGHAVDLNASENFKLKSWFEEMSNCFAPAFGHQTSKA